MAGDFRVQVKGVVEFHRALKTMQQPMLTQVVGASMKESSTQVLVPAIKAKAPPGPAPHTSAERGTRGRKGPLSKTVTTRKAKARGRRDAREMVAYNTGPRAWYRHFVIQGTQRHSLYPGARVRTGRYQDRGLIHPGSKDNNFVEEAVSGKQLQVAAAMGDAVIRRAAEALK